jgi:hypothetical protein
MYHQNEIRNFFGDDYSLINPIKNEIFPFFEMISDIYIIKLRDLFND